jgi:hypothetical protein
MSITNNEILQRLSNLGMGSVRMLTEINTNPELIDAYVDYAISNEKYAWRAAWVLQHLSQSNPEKLQKHSDKFVMALNSIEIHGHIREMLKIILNLKLSEEQTSEVFDSCYQLLQNNKMQSSVRFTCFNFLLKVANDYPELKEEIRIIFENIKEYLSPGIKRGMELRLQKEILTK